MDQDEYISALKPIVHADLTGAPSDRALNHNLTKLFWSLLGALAYAMLTQHWLAVYVVNLQRATQAPLVIHIRRLNALVRIAQKRLVALVYPAMDCIKHVAAHSDSSFCREEDKGYGMKGANFIREGRSKKDGTTVHHLLDISCGGHKLTTRSTFSAELFAAVSAADSLIPLVTTLHEMANGTLSRTGARRLREEGGLCFRTTLTIDAMSLFAAVSQAIVRVPSEKSLAGHLFWLRELLDRGLLSQIQWADTRDMSADGHTIGSVDRTTILDLMNGMFKFQHATKSYPAR